MVHIGLIEKYLRNEMILLLNSYPLLKINLRGLGHPDSHTSLNILDILSEDLSMIGTYEISNHPVARSIKVKHNN